jgi:hypothetical protein
VYGLAANSSLAPVVPLPAVVNELQRGAVDLRYEMSRRAAAGVAYWYDAYAVTDFALGPETLNGLSQPSFLTFGSLYRPYTAHTITARLTYSW